MRKRRVCLLIEMMTCVSLPRLRKGDLGLPEQTTILQVQANVMRPVKKKRKR